MKMIHDSHGYQLKARVSRHAITGKTVELFVRYPLAERPRDQRIATLTLPQASFSRLAAVMLHEDKGDES